MPASNASRCEPSIASEGIHDSDVIELWWRKRAIMRDCAYAADLCFGLSMSYDALVVGPVPTGWRRRSRWLGRGGGCSCWRPPSAPVARSRPRSSTLPGFRHDTFSSVYPAGAASPVFARHAARAPRLALGASGCVLCASAPRRQGRRALPRSRAHGCEPRRGPPRRR